MPFTPGHSGNPAARPPGARNKATLALEARYEERLAGVFEQVLQRAEAGDMSAARLVLSRLMPMGRRVAFEMPEIGSFADLAKALSGLIAAMATGEVTVREGAVIGRMLQNLAAALHVARRQEERAAEVPARAAARPAPAKIQRNTMMPAAPSVRAAAVAEGQLGQLDGLLAPAGSAAAIRPMRGPSTASVALVPGGSAAVRAA